MKMNSINMTHICLLNRKKIILLISTFQIENNLSDLQSISSTPVHGLRDNDRLSVTVPSTLTVSRLAVVRVRADLDFCEGWVSSSQIHFVLFCSG